METMNETKTKPDPIAAIRRLLEHSAQHYGEGEIWRDAAEAVEALNPAPIRRRADMGGEEAMTQKTRTEMYRTVREALAMGSGAAFMQLRMDAWGSLDALEAQEREAKIQAIHEALSSSEAEAMGVHAVTIERDDEDDELLSEADIDCEMIAQREDATPPAPPAAECGVRKALEVYADENQWGRSRHDGPVDLWLNYVGGPDASEEQLDACWNGPDAARAALATPCCEGLRADLEDWKRRAQLRERVYAEVSAKETERKNAAEHAHNQRIEIGRLTAELAQQRKATEEARRMADSDLILERAWRKKFTAENGQLRAELAKAVDALRKSQLFLTHREDTTEVCYDWCPRCKVDNSLAAYDAKHGKVQP